MAKGKGSEKAKPNQEQGWSTVRPTPGRCIKTRNAKCILKSQIP